MLYTEWIEQLVISGDDDSRGVATDSNGNVYISGSTDGNFDGVNAGSYDAWVAKYDAQGNLLWTQQLGTSNNDFTAGVVTDSNSNVYISGYTDGSFDGVNTGSYDAWVAKYDAQGNWLWTQQLGTSGSEFSEGVATDSNGNVYISGSTDGSFDGVNAGEYDAWVAKYDAQGNWLWTQQLGTSEYDGSEGVATDSNGNVYLSGYTGGSFDGTPNAGISDAWVAKYDGQGNLLWTQQLGTSGYDGSEGVATDSNGNVYLSGYTGGSFDGTPNVGISDAWVAKYDGQGNWLWTQQIGTSSIDNSLGVATDSKNNVYISGSTDGSFEGVNAGENDAWVAKYDDLGNLLWTQQLGTTREDLSWGVATDSKDNVYISGFTEGSFDGVNAVDDDAWVAKISQSNPPIYRFQNNALPGTYLFAGQAESQNIRQNYPNFIEEGQAFKVAFEPGDNLIRMNRFQNSNILGTYLYAGEAESQNIRQNYPNFIEEGIAFYVYPGSTEIGVDFYRFQNLDVPGTYVFVGGEERQNILDNFPNFVEEGVAFKVEI